MFCQRVVLSTFALDSFHIIIFRRTIVISSRTLFGLREIGILCLVNLMLGVLSCCAPSQLAACISSPTATNARTPACPDKFQSTNWSRGETSRGNDQAAWQQPSSLTHTHGCTRKENSVSIVSKSSRRLQCCFISLLVEQLDQEKHAGT